MHPFNKVVDLTGVGTNISLNCKALGNPSYSWEKQGRLSVLPSNTRGQNTNVLSFINITVENAGNYRCVATNGSGSSYSNYASVVVMGKYIIAFVNTNVQ